MLKYMLLLNYLYKMALKNKILDIFSHFLNLSVFAYLLSKSITSQCFSLFDSWTTLLCIIFSIGITFYNWTTGED